MFIYLIRHGETPWNAEQRILGATDIGLTPTGLRQAEALSDALSDRPIRAVYSSDLSRALRTADALARPHALEIRARPDLREMNQGFLEGAACFEPRRNFLPCLKRWTARDAPHSPGMFRICGRKAPSPRLNTTRR